MALSLGVRNGTRLRVGQSNVNVVSVGPGQRILLDVQGAKHLVTEEERVEIMPTVFVSMGKESSANGSPAHRLAFEAPRSVRITRV